MLLHDLVDIKNGRVISGQKELTLDEDYGGRTLYVYQLGSTFKGKLHANPTTYPVVSLSTKEEIEKWAKENNFAEVRFMNVTDSKTKDDWSPEAREKALEARKRNAKGESSELSKHSPPQTQFQYKGSNIIAYQTPGGWKAYSKHNGQVINSEGGSWKSPEEAANSVKGSMKDTKDQIAELESQKEQAKKQGYGTDAYDAAIAELQKYSTDGGPGSGQKGHTTPDPTTHQERRKERENLMIYYKNAVKRGDRETAQKISQRLQHINSLQLKDSDDTCDAKEVVQEGDIQGRHYQIYKENDTFFGNVEGISHYFQANTHSQVLKNIIDSIKTSSKDEDDTFTQDPLTEKGKEILEAMKKQYGEKKGEDIFYASKNKGIITGVDAKDSDIIINISENPDKFEEKAFDCIHYNGYNIKQIKETGEFDIYDLGGAIIGHTATFELAKIFIDNKGRSIIGQAE